MKKITDEYMQQMIGSAKQYTTVLLKKGPQYSRPDVMAFIWEHARKNFELKEEGILNIVCPVNDGSELTGVGVFNASLEETRQIMDADPGVKEGVFVYEAHEARGFKGDSLL